MPSARGSVLEKPPDVDHELLVLVGTSTGEIILGSVSSWSQPEDEFTPTDTPNTPGSDYFDSNNLVGIYFHNIAEHPLLTEEQEVELGKRMEAGLFAEKLLEDRENESKEQVAPGHPTTKVSATELAFLAEDGKAARKEFIESNLKLVPGIAKKYRNRGLSEEDLIQEGNLGLITAVGLYDYTRGNKFSTNAVLRIRQAIGRALADQSRVIRIPVHMIETFGKVSRAERQLTDTFGRPPTTDELAVEMSMTPDAINEIQEYRRIPGSLNRVEEDDEGSGSEVGDRIEDGDALSPDAAAVLSERQSLIQRMLHDSKLTLLEQRTLELRLGLFDGRDRSRKEIAELTDNISTRTVSNREAAAIAKIQLYCRELGLDRESI
jgi:RNA polymerase primary sigma factor